MAVPIVECMHNIDFIVFINLSIIFTREVRLTYYNLIIHIISNQIMLSLKAISKIDVDIFNFNWVY